jgi:hypothetical protein
MTATGKVTIAEILALLTAARALIDAGPHADPRDRAAYLSAKADLLARIADTTPEQKAP